MKQYMLSVHHDSKDAFEGRDLTPEDFQRMFEQVDAFNEDLTSSGRLGVRRRAHAARHRNDRA
ncbi:MAG: hypothetical protein V9G12_10580 [Microthrixaceae bacterium]